MHLDQITAVSHLEADVITMANIVEEEEKKRLDTLREKVEDIIEEEKEKEKGKSMAHEVDKEVEKPSHKLEEISEKEKELVEEVLRKGATAPPVTPLPPSKEEFIEAQNEFANKSKADSNENEKVDEVAEVFKAVTGDKEAKKKDISQ